MLTSPIVICKVLSVPYSIFRTNIFWEQMRKENIYGVEVYYLYKFEYVN